jgi:hypothetical protein
LNTGYEKTHNEDKNITLTLYDGLKLIGKTEEELHMEFRLDKYANIVPKKGKLVHSQNLILDIKIQELDQGKATST